VAIGTAPAGGPGAPLTATPGSADFGAEPLGRTFATTVTLKNNSGQPETVNAVTPPPAPYTATLPAVGTVVAPGATVSVPVTFTPTSPAVFADTFTVSTTSGDVTVALTGSGDPTFPALTSWTTNGLATLGGSTVTLTKDGQLQGAGSIVAPQTVSPLGVHARFTAQIGGARTTGADGLTFALLDASATTANALGSVGSGLGVGGLPAVFVSLNTFSNGPVKSNNFVAVGTAKAGSNLVTFLQTSTAIRALRKGTHTVDVLVTQSASSYVTVEIDGKLVMRVVVQLPAKVRVAFTGAVGGVTDTHAVIDPIVTYVSAG
jgi:Bacterial lectin